MLNEVCSMFSLSLGEVKISFTAKGKKLFQVNFKEITAFQIYKSDTHVRSVLKFHLCRICSANSIHLQQK